MVDRSPEEKEKASREDALVLNTQPIPGNTKYIQVENVDYALALQTGPQLTATSSRSIQLFAILLVAFMGSLSNGFDGSGEHHHSHSSFMILIHIFWWAVMSAVNGMQ
jgi:hypothetical protein